MKRKLTTITAPSTQLVEITAALLERESRSDGSTLEATIKQCMGMLPPFFKVVEIKTENKNGDPSEVKCPVTKQVVRNRDNEDDMVSFASSPACIAEFDDVELDCALIVNPDLEDAWEDFCNNTPNYDGYEDMIRKFIIMNHNLFAGRKLTLAITENQGGGCGGSHSIMSYSLLDSSEHAQTPRIKRETSEERLLRTATALQRELRRNYEKPLSKSGKAQLQLTQHEISRMTKVIAGERTKPTKKINKS